MEIKIIDENNQTDIRLPNQPFTLWGRMVPSYVGGQWSYAVEQFSEVTQMCFPDENYDFSAMKNNSVFIGAYDGGKCVGLAVMQDAPMRYMYLYDLKVDRDYRKRGVATALLDRAKEVCRAKGYRGIYTQGQDNNLSACLFYIKYGFTIGGLDTDVYKGSKQEGKSDIIFYCDL